MLDTANYFFLTRLQGMNVSTIEKFGNFCLTPAQYLWNGKKVDLIQTGSNTAIQIDYIYDPSESYPWEKTAFMITLFIPSTLIGAACKLYSSYAYPFHQEEDAWIKRCLQNRPESSQILCPKGQAYFAQEVQCFINALKEIEHHRYNYLNFPKDEKPVFLSDIIGLELPPEAHHRRYSNRDILNRINFLWNLAAIDVGDFYNGLSEIGPEKHALCCFNSTVTSSQEKQDMKAKDFFKKLEERRATLTSHRTRFSAK